jgi:mono/diheme cytochrome c family protein
VRTGATSPGRRALARGAAVVAAVLALAGLAAVARAQGEWKAPRAAKALRNPVTGVGGAGAVVEANCASCHGDGGKGNGPAALALPTKPADWTSARVQQQSDGEIFWKITNGRAVMPAWKHLPEQTRWELVNYIRSLKAS